MRIRIALCTATAVIVIPITTFAFTSSSPAASAKSTHHQVHGPIASGLSGTQLASFAVPTTVPAVMNPEIKVGRGQLNPASDPASVQAAAALARYAALVRYEALVRHAALVKAAAVVQPPPAPAPAPPVGSPSDSTSVNTADWSCIRTHESGGNYGEHGGGAYQFEDATWHSLTGLAGSAQDYPPATQDDAALRLHAQRGWEPWTTRYVCGL